jgi:T-complex protein 1 subunit zeta
VLFRGSRRRRPPVVRAGRCCSALAAAVVRQGLHPRIICEGYDLARDHIIAKLDEWKVPLKPAEGGGLDREILESVARTSLRTKLNAELAETLVDAVTQAVMCVHKPDEAIDLHMVEVRARRASR